MNVDAEIVDEILTELTLERPNTMKSVNKIINAMINGDQESFYGLLIGEIQSGKTPAQMILMWIFTYHPSFCGSVCFITKNLDSIRRDIMSKFNSDLINKHVDVVCARRGVSGDMFKVNCAVYNSGLDGNADAIQVMLMQRNNFISVRRWLEGLPESVPVLFVIDEIHEMYGGARSMVSKNGLETHTKIPNIGMLHWLKSKMETRKVNIIGVTATPYSVLSADAVCLPTHIFHLDTDAPTHGLEYYGYLDGALKGVETAVYNTTANGLVELDTIEEIISRPKNVLENGNTEVTFICITNCLKNDQHEDMRDALVERFGDRISCLIFNQTKNKSLHAWFNEDVKLTPEICETGAIVIIGRACLAAGITVKPAKHTIKTVNDVKYQITGITDQFMPATDTVNIVSTKQLMRILGWFPTGHKATLWITDDRMTSLYTNDMGTITQKFIEQYDLTAGPESLERIHLDTAYIRNFYSDTFYRVTGRFGMHLVPSNDENIETNKLETSFVAVDTTHNEEFAERTLQSFSGQTQDQRKLRKMLFGETGSRRRMLIGYDEGRYYDIMKFALSPSEKNPLSQVNGFLWGPDGVKSLIRDCKIVNFVHDWDSVQRTGDKNAFQLPNGKWLQLKQVKILTHQMIQRFKDIKNPRLDVEPQQPDSLSSVHHEVLRTLNKLATVPTTLQKFNVKLKVSSLRR